MLISDSSVSRMEWPTGVVVNAIKSNDDKVRQVEVRLLRDGKFVTYTRPISELVLLMRKEKPCIQLHFSSHH